MYHLRAWLMVFAPLVVSLFLMSAAVASPHSLSQIEELSKRSSWCHRSGHLAATEVLKPNQLIYEIEQKWPWDKDYKVTQRRYFVGFDGDQLITRIPHSPNDYYFKTSLNSNGEACIFGGKSYKNYGSPNQESSCNKLYLKKVGTDRLSVHEITCSKDCDDCSLGSGPDAVYRGKLVRAKRLSK